MKRSIRWLIAFGLSMFIIPFAMAGETREPPIESTGAIPRGTSATETPPEILNVTAAYHWPWGVGVRYEVTGSVPLKANFHLTATDRAGIATYTAETNTFSGDTEKDPGVHQLIWNLDQQGVNIQSSNVVFTVRYGPLYCVVDLSAGADATSYPVTWLDEPPSGGFNTDEYKTSKLVLRGIEAGTFTMGSPTNELGRRDNEIQHQVTLTKPFFSGIKEIKPSAVAKYRRNEPLRRKHEDDETAVGNRIDVHDCNGRRAGGRIALFRDESGGASSRRRDI